MTWRVAARRSLAPIMMVLLSPSAASGGEACWPAVSGVGRVAAVPEADVLRLDDGRLVRLAGIAAPRRLAQPEPESADAPSFGGAAAEDPDDPAPGVGDDEFERPPLGWRAPPPGRPADPSARRLGSARNALAALAEGRLVELRAWRTGRPSAPLVDRHGRLVAEVVLAPAAPVVAAGWGSAASAGAEAPWPNVAGRAEAARGPDGVWLQAALVRAGEALVVPAAWSRPCVRVLYGQEVAARAEGVGLWAEPAFQVRRADDPRLADWAGGYAVVSGTVISVGHAAGRSYLNFGRDFRGDFTVTIDDKERAAFTAAGFAPASLAGRTVRLRGILASRDGAAMALTLPEEIEWVR
jgi:hypothetical protein